MYWVQCCPPGDSKSRLPPAFVLLTLHPFHAALFLQGFSHLQKGTYAELMRDWIAGAEVLERSAVAATCSIDQATDSNAGDLLVHYTSIQDYSSVAKLLPPMLPDVKVGDAAAAL